MAATSGAERNRSHAPGLAAAGWALCLGSLGMVALSVAYAVSPSAAAMPAAPLDIEAAIAGATAGTASMRLISALGVPADILITSGALMLANDAFGRGRGWEAQGWTLIGLSSLLFFTIDLVVGMVLPALAESGAREAFHAMKLFFDQMFIGGTFAFGMGAALLGSTMLVSRRLPLWLGAPLALAGLVACLGGGAAYFGANVAKILGLAIAVGGVVSTIIGARIVMAKVD